MTEKLEHAIRMAESYELILSKQLSTVVLVAMEALCKGLNNPELARLLQDEINALTYARTSGMMFLSLAKQENEPEMIANLDEQRELILEKLNEPPP